MSFAEAASPEPTVSRMSVVTGDITRLAVDAIAELPRSVFVCCFDAENAAFYEQQQSGP